MTAIATSLTGPVAYAIGLIGIAIAGGADAVGRRTHGVRTPRLHDRVGGIGAGLCGPAAFQRVRRERGGGVTMQNTDRPRDIVIHQSANRPNQILGGDRELVLIAMLTAISLAFSLGNWWGIGLSVGSGSEQWRCFSAWGSPIRCSGKYMPDTSGTRRSIRRKSGLLSRCVSISRNWR